MFGSLILVFFAIIQVSSYYVTSLTNLIQSSLFSLKNEELHAEVEHKPDIYYIILDAYARADVMQDFYGYDNSHFVEQLTDLGFYVAPCSQSNYAWTGLSLTSSLNMNYLQELYISADSLPAWKYSAVRQELKKLGYK